jgi:signal peptidase II
MKKALAVVLGVLFIDQAVKIYIKTHFYLGERISIMGDWFYLHFTENNGMAFGMEFEGAYGKLFLSIFRIIAVSGIGWYITKLIKEKAHQGFIIAMSLIFAGALGNIIDSAFYGLIFSDVDHWGQDVATIFPPEGGYGTFLHGRVVDMLYFPIVEGNFPESFPIWSGEPFTFFSPVFNIADSSITIGVALILLFQKKFFKEEAVVSSQSNLETTTQPTENTGDVIS